MFKRVKSYFKRLKEDAQYIKFCRTTSDYILQTNDRHMNYKPVNDVMPQLKGLKIGFVNSMESVYFTFMSVYGRNLTQMRIRGYHIEITPEYKVIFHIYCETWSHHRFSRRVY